MIVILEGPKIVVVFSKIKKKTVIVIVSASSTRISGKFPFSNICNEY